MMNKSELVAALAEKTGATTDVKKICFILII